jgi:hypothetical protein
MDEKNLQLKEIPETDGFTEEEARLFLQGKTIPPRIKPDEMVE